MNVKVCSSLLIMAVAGSAVASPPWLTEWSRTVPWKHLVARISFTKTYTNSQNKTELPRAQLSYGLTSTTELIIRGSQVNLQRGATLTSGVSDMALGVKQRVYDHAGVQAGFAYTLSVPTGTKSEGLGSAGYDHTVTMMMSKKFSGGQQLSASLGINAYGKKANKTNTFGGLLYTLTLPSKLTLGGEIFATTPQKPGARSEFAWGVGFTKPISPSQALLARVGRSTRGFSNLNLFFGLQTDWKP